ncbi:MAG: exodeoxyribonuclease VII small subunit [Ruminococcus sp.]|nr:exodeoxyribonuclease VII small subunit [Ruminococcus sp.]
MNEVENFEKSVKRLEEIVSKLEAGDLTLAESIQLYKEGSELAESCRSALRTAELSVKVNDEQ